MRGRQDLLQLLDIPPLAMIPIMLTAGDRIARRKRRVGAVMGAAASLVVALLMVHLLYRPLDVLWAVALRRMGIEV